MLKNIINFRRIFNFFHPRGPNCELLVDSGVALNNISVFKLYDKESSRRQSKSIIDFESAKGVTQEDYILSLDKDKNASFQFGECLIYSVSNGRLNGPDGDVLTKDKMLLSQFTPQNGSGLSHSAFKKIRYGDIKTLKGVVLSLCTPYSSNYYHWLIEALPILRAFSKSELDQIDYFVVPKKKNFLLDSLLGLGIPKEKVVELVGNDTLICDELLISSYSKCVAPNPNAVEWLRERYDYSSTKHEPKNKQMLYLSRGDSNWRGVANEAEVEKYLLEKGFQILELSQYTFKDQQQLFSSANVVIAAHGAGLANIVFCNSGTKVLEIHPARWTSLCYAHLASQVGCDYFYCNAEEVGLTKEEVDERRRSIPDSSVSQSEDSYISIKKMSAFLNTQVL